MHDIYNLCSISTLNTVLIFLCEILILSNRLHNCLFYKQFPWQYIHNLRHNHVGNIFLEEYSPGDIAKNETQRQMQVSEENYTSANQLESWTQTKRKRIRLDHSWLAKQTKTNTNGLRKLGVLF